MAWTSERPAAAQIAQAIRHYLEAHPQAVDTERGIQNGGCAMVRTCPSADDVRAALGSSRPLEKWWSVLPDGQRVRWCQRNEPATPEASVEPDNLDGGTLCQRP